MAQFGEFLSKEFRQSRYLGANRIGANHFLPSLKTMQFFMNKVDGHTGSFADCDNSLGLMPVAVIICAGKK